LRSGASIKSVQHNLGHKTAKMTVDRYARYTEDTGKTDAAKLSNYLKENADAAN
jgi:integrase